MKPILLKIEGLNSFAERREIDFEKLSAKGLFGIFGDTGSGKSSVLDAITLALFARVARYDGSKGEASYINVNWDGPLYVYLEFEARSRRYVVEREFKRAAQKAAMKSTLARLIRKTGEGAEVIAESKVTEVNEKVVEILGLSYNDFSRSVLLAQGRFGEFLMLGKKDRGDMLERIFRLEAYGEACYRKVKDELDSTRAGLREVSAAPEVSEASLEELLASHTRRLNENSSEAKNLRLRRELADARLLGLLQHSKDFDEYTRYVEAVNSYERRRPEFERKRETLARAVKLLHGKLIIEGYLSVKKRLEKAEAEERRCREGLAAALSRLKTEEDEQQTRIKKLLADIEAGERELAKKQARLQELSQLLEALRDRHKAGELAARLTPGKPCMVCGSAHHPNPAIQDVTPEGKRARQEWNELEAEARRLGELLQEQRQQAQAGSAQGQKLDKARKACDQAQGELRAQSAIRLSLAEQSEEDGERLSGFLEQVGLGGIDEALAIMQSAGDVEDLERQVSAFDDGAKDAGANAARLAQRLTDIDPARLSAELDSARAQLAELDQAITSLTREDAQLQSGIDQARRDLESHKALAKRREELVKLEYMLDDLAKLLEGKKFVEFVATRHLRAIAREASSRMRGMTAGRFTIELDEYQAELLIVDSFGGGARRTPRSLSGGETFMASLCLALALASKIALRSNTSLEMFFLDEGFGTLDRASLDMLMNALESLASENLSIGIISHVEELRGRVPAKLIVRSDKFGMSGTEFTLET